MAALQAASGTEPQLSRRRINPSSEPCMLGMLLAALDGALAVLSRKIVEGERT
ncbi:hypothetical protein ACFVDI_07330 [Nocardioides sp. NPDC057767]|uniref:hypothetical protein n=1 Tax=unclassified Nocardioides TaxID=2615069 RepID=UPI00366D53BF